MNKEQKQSLMAAIIVAGFVIAIVNCYTNLCKGMGYPYATFVFEPWSRFTDFFSFKNIYFDPYTRMDVLQRPILQSCFPFLYVITSELFVLPPNLAFGIFNFVFFGTLLAFSWRQLRGNASVFGTCRDVLIFTCLSYPVLFCIDRGNFEEWQFVLMVIFYYSFSRKRYYAAATALGLAIACKPFPVVFLILFLSEGEYLPALFSGLLAVALTCASLLMFDYGFSTNLHLWLDGLSDYGGGYVIGDQALYFGHSFFGMLKFMYYLVWSNHTPAGLTRLSKVYFPIAAVFGLACWVYLFAFRRSLLAWEKWAILLLCMTALPFASADYTLLSYFIPIYLFVNAPQTTRWRDFTVTVLFSLLLIPKSYFHWLQNLPQTMIGVVVTPLIQLAIVSIIVCRMYPKQLTVPEAAAASPTPAISPRVAPPSNKKKKKKERNRKRFHPVN